MLVFLRFCALGPSPSLRPEGRAASDQREFATDSSAASLSTRPSMTRDVSGVSSMTSSSGTTARTILLPLLLVLRWARLHEHERRGLEPGGDAAERLALAALLLVLPRAKESLAPGGVIIGTQAAH